MLRGLFTNRNVQNLLASGLAPGTTVHAGSGERLSLHAAAERYARQGRSVVLLAGERYGMGSSRDWAAKGVALLGVRCVLARSFERIHRSNLIGMGILPLRLPDDRRPQDLGLEVEDLIEIDAPPDAIRPRAEISVQITRKGKRLDSFIAASAIETGLESDTLRAGGLLPLILHRAESR
jgi:aconitate hydratase